MAVELDVILGDGELLRRSGDNMVGITVDDIVASAVSGQYTIAPAMTQEEYDLLDPPDPNTIYIITSSSPSSGGDSSVVAIDAGSDLSAARTPGAVHAIWKFDFGTDVGVGGVNIVNAVEGDTFYVRTA